MADSFAALAYGVCVRSCDLVVASQVHSTLSAPLYALDLIRNRRRQAQLQTTLGSSSWSTRSKVEELSDEVWKTISQALIDLETEHVRLALMAQFACESCTVVRKATLARQLAAADGVREFVPPAKYLARAALQVRDEREKRRRRTVWDADWIARGEESLHKGELREQSVDWSLNAMKNALASDVSISYPSRHEMIDRSRLTCVAPSQAMSSLLSRFGLKLPLKDSLAGSLTCLPSAHTTVLAITPRTDHGDACDSASRMEADPGDEDEYHMSDPGSVVELLLDTIERTEKGNKALKLFLETYHIHISTDFTVREAPLEGARRGGRAASRGTRRDGCSSTRQGSVEAGCGAGGAGITDVAYLTQ